MSAKRTIRVIKKQDRDAARNPQQPQVNTARDTAREMVGNVTDWVTEFQARRRRETSNALKTLFPDTPRPSEI
jgi:hypothetical protein